MSSSIPASGTERVSGPGDVDARPAAAIPSPTRETSWRFARRNPTLAAGALCLVLIAVSALGAHLWGTTDPQALRPVIRLHPPSAEQWFGTDQYGRDIYSRTLYGGRISLLVGTTVGVTSLLLGVIVGLVGGYYRRANAVVMRVMSLWPFRPSCSRWPLRPSCARA